MKTKAPRHYTERVRQIIYLLVYVIFAERAFPTPFIQSRFGQLTYLIILFFIVKNVFVYKQEKSPIFYAKTQRWKAKWDSRKVRFSDFTRYRIQRIIRTLFMLYAVGWLLDGASSSCTGAFNCVTNIPFMLVTNWQELLMFAIRLAMSMFSIFGMMFLLARMDLHNTILPDSIKTRFSDVYGQDAAVARVKEVLEILDNPEVVESQGGYMPGGILLTGPPGTGKSYIAEAAAGETGKPFVMVGPESFTNMFVGVPIMKVKMLYRYLRKLSVKYGGVIVFFDEIDALGNRGMGVVNQFVNKLFGHTQDKVVVQGGGAAGSGALQMILTEMSGVQKPKGLYNKVRVFLGFKPVPPPRYRILHMAATNMEESLDAAMLRPGRYDRKIRVGRPDMNGRIATLDGYLNKIKHDLTGEQVRVLAMNNPQATGASIKDIVNEALLKAIREGRDTVSWEDMRDVIIWKGLGEDDGRAPTEEDNRRVALHEAAHAVAAHHYRKHSRIQFASIHRRGRTGGVVSAVPIEERTTQTRNEMESEICVALASVWAEKFFYDENMTTGPSSDLQKANKIAKDMFAKYAMGSSLMVYDDDQIPSELLEEVRDYLQEIYEYLGETMYKYRDQVEAVAQLLDRYGTVDGDEIHELLERMS